MKIIRDATTCLANAWPHIVAECRQVLGSELHYQAMVYHCLRLHADVPIDQIGMNVKMWIDNPTSKLFQELDRRKHIEYQGGFEPIPDVCLFKPKVKGDWRRRSYDRTLNSLLVAIEIKASERDKNRLRPGEIVFDIEKLAAHREEAKALHSNFQPVMMVIDTAPEPAERMTAEGLRTSMAAAHEHDVEFLYVSPDNEINSVV